MENRSFSDWKTMYRPSGLSEGPTLVRPEPHSTHSRTSPVSYGSVLPAMSGRYSASIARHHCIEMLSWDRPNSYSIAPSQPR